MTSFYPASYQPSTSVRVSQAETPVSCPHHQNDQTQDQMIKLRGEVIIQRKKQTAKRMKNNFKEMVHNPNSINAVKTMAVTAVDNVRYATA
jgi:hypothetical protein